MKFGGHDPRGPLPPVTLVNDDDGEVRELALFFGVIDKFTEGGPTTMQVEPFDEHPTHWVLISRWVGYPVPADNGWRAEFYPKSDFSFDDVAQMLNDRKAEMRNAREFRRGGN